MSTINKEAMLRINGGASSDQQEASDFCRQVTNWAEGLAKVINDVVNLDVILSESSLRSVRDALAGLRHIDAVVAEISSFHQNGQLGPALANFQKKIAGMRALAEQQYQKLNAMFPV